jgi:hypothetical protein
LTKAGGSGVKIEAALKFNGFFALLAVDRTPQNR